MSVPQRQEGQQGGGQDLRQPRSDGAHRNSGYRDALEDFRRMKDLNPSQDDADRIAEQPLLVSRFYDVVTRFYEFGWGSTFHFSPRRPGETLAASQRRHDLELGILRLEPGMEVADVGCGVGGDGHLRATGANITGINFNAYQIARGWIEGGLGKDLPLPGQLHGSSPRRRRRHLAFESVCHAPNNLLLFRELHRLLRPGGEMAVVDWCFTGFDGSVAAP